PAITTPEKLAEHLGWPARRVRRIAKQLGACLVSGSSMVLTETDVHKIMESQRCPSTYSSATVSGTAGAPLPDGSYADLLKQRTKPLRRAKLTRLNKESGNVVTMGRARSCPLLKPRCTTGAAARTTSGYHLSRIT